ncbi:MAG TPA: prenyltransferase/squalene oxidase repeat-containing protein [Pirellulales bacterium]|nr:prenyltransferase/squalene oxidase repeat-containing protein [Pirellulales bacterium]
MVDYERLSGAYRAARRELLERRNSAGHWEGRLSSSALSTATAVSALAIVRRQLERDDSPSSFELQERLERLIFGGLDWLVPAQNRDGGWGDTDRSVSNIATTMLVRAAFQLTCLPAADPELLQRADQYVRTQGGIAGLRRRYGRDKTFAVPILTNCALAGLVSWKEVSPLPFELACFPQAWFRFLRLPVVSYAIPALVAIGQARFFHRPPWNPLVRWWRRAAVEKSLRVLEKLQPAGGGFLEATPLTSFVVMSLASIGQARHPVARRGLDFLLNSVREDGSWPIDTNLATWVTTLSLNALATGDTETAVEASERCADWLLDCQCRDVHPYTGATAGGWGWSDLSGSVPDADDTSGALLALASYDQDARVADAARLGITWLLDLQNSDGGWPTFCRGWGKLPFDRSGSDLTAHALRALHAWREDGLPSPSSGGRDGLGRPSSASIDRAIDAGFQYLARQQQPDGSWIPLWFGNQHHAREENPLYGTARVLLAYADFGKLDHPAARRAAAWLAKQQRSDGGWGAEPSVEETALAVEALLALDGDSAYHQHVERGLSWLIESVESGRFRQCSPIGFYFAKLWYYEALYPIVFSVSALGRAVRRCEPAPARRRVDLLPRLPEPTLLRPSPAPLS